MVVVRLGAFMASVDATVTNVALHTLGTDLHSSVGSVQWVITGYLLSLAATIPVSGWAARRFGARALYIAALALFAGSSGLCALANSLGMLVACRVLQGVAAGILSPLSQLITAEVVGPDQMGRVLGRVWVATALGAVLGPSLGGVIVDSLGWRWIFLINVPLGAIATVAAFYLLPETPARPPGRLDVTGFLRLSIAIPSLVYALAQAGAASDPTSPAVLAPLTIGVALLCDFVRHALRSAYPLLDLRLFARRLFATGMLSLFTLNAAWFGVLLLLPLYFQQVRHAAPAVAGLLVAPQGLGTLGGMWVSGRVRSPRAGRRLGALGTAAFTLTTVALAHIGATTSYQLLCLVLVVSGFGAGLAWVPATAAGYLGLSPDQVSHASPLLTVTVRLGASFGTAFAAIVLQRALNGSSRIPTATHILAAYHSSFQWLVSASCVAVLLFIVLSQHRLRSAPPRPPSRPARLGVDLP